jgi:hypothetical protein
MIKLKNENYMEFKDTMYEKAEFKDFIEKYFSLFTLFLEKNIPPLEELTVIINAKARVETGEITQEQASLLIKEAINEKYIYRKFGGKTNFDNYIKKVGEAKEKEEKNKQEKNKSIKNTKSKKEILDIVNKNK